MGSSAHRARRGGRPRRRTGRAAWTPARPGTPRRTAGASARDREPRAGRSWLVGAEPPQPEAGERLQVGKLFPEDRGARTGQPVRTAPIDRLEGLDEASPLEPGKRRIERARP